MKIINFNHLFNEYKIFADTCTLINPSFHKFYDTILSPFYQITRNKIIIPSMVFQELERLEKRDNTRHNASKVLKLITSRNKIDSVFEIRGEASDSFADNLFLSVFTKYRLKYNLCLLTNDFKLSYDICNLRNQLSINNSSINDIVCIFLNRNEEPEIFNPHLYEKKNTAHLKRKYPEKKISNNVIFQPHNNWKPGQKLFSPNGVELEYQLLTRGGEAHILKVKREEKIAKVFFAERITQEKYSKLKLMIQTKLRSKQIIWPSTFIVDRGGNFLGYIMDFKAGLTLREMCFYPTKLKNEGKISRKDLVYLCLEILKQVALLHRNNIIIGDINPDNFIIDDNHKVYFIDTDSYQIKEYPCSVGTDLFTAPEIQGINFATFQRNEEHELFAIATLLFMILMPGKHPFSQIDGGSPAENIRAKKFPYRFNDESSGTHFDGYKTPKGSWFYIWNNMPFMIKELFIKSFTQEKRATIREWQLALKKYISFIEKGYHSNELFPTTIKTNTTINKES